MNKGGAADGGILYTGPADFPRLSANTIPGHSARCSSGRADTGEVQVLLFLANHPGNDTARDVVELRGLPKSQVSRAVDLLVSRGFLQRRPDETDRRVIHLAITEAGKPLARGGPGDSGGLLAADLLRTDGYRAEDPGLR